MINNKLIIAVIMAFHLSLESCETFVGPDEPNMVIKDNFVLMSDGKLVPGFGMGLNDGAKKRDWIRGDSTSLKILYPGGLEWGGVFITVGGDPVDRLKPWIDISACSELSVVMKGETGGEEVFIGIKDKDDENSETRKYVILTDDWKVYQFSLSEFNTCSLSQVYVIPEFIFHSCADTAVSIEVKSITISK